MDKQEREHSREDAPIVYLVPPVITEILEQQRRILEMQDFILKCMALPPIMFKE